MEPNKIQSAYMESFDFLQERKRRQVNQLALLCNLNRGDQNISATLILTLFNRSLSALYDDRMQVKFLPSQNILQEQINAYNKLYESDYLEMAKSKLDYDWCWDTLFFGRGYMETLRFNKKKKIMQPHVINPLMFGYDPYFEEVQEWRYYWKWITKSKVEIDALIKAKVITGVDKAIDIPSGIDPLIYDYKVRRDQAMKAVAPSIDSRDGDVFQILEYYGYNEKTGEKMVNWVDRDFSKTLFTEKLDLGDGDIITTPSGESVSMGSKWPIVVKEAFRIPHASVPFSVADLLDDKHRAMSVLLNLAYIAAKDRANPLYWYDPDKVKDVSQFLSRQVNQHIPVDGDGSLAVGPLNTKDAMPSDLINFMTFINQQANDPLGTGVSVEPSTGGQETATEVAIDQQLNDMATSLQSKVLQFGEAEFCSHWFHRYAKNGKELGSKMANIVGVKGIESTEVELNNFNQLYPPGVHVYSAKEAEYKNLVKRRDFMTIFPALQESMDPDGFRNFQKHVFMPLMLEDPSLIDIMFPNTLDERKANDENEQLKENQLPVVEETDDHTTHIYIHSMLMPKTWAAWFHIMEHEELLAEQKRQEQIAMQTAETPQPQIGKVQVGAEKKSPQAAASPLKSEMKSSNKNVMSKK